MIGHTALRIVVGTDSFRTVAGTDKALSLRGLSLLLLSDPHGVEAGSEHLHRALLILTLASFVLALHDKTSRQVRDSDRGVRLLHVLSAGA